MNAQKCSKLALHLTCTFFATLFGLPSMLNAQAPSVVDPNLRVRTVIENLDQPTSMAFLGYSDPAFSWKFEVARRALVS